MLVVVIGWMFVVVLMTAAEAMSPQGTLLGALVTFVLYGALPLSIVMYVLGTPGRYRRRRARQQAEDESRELERSRPDASSSDPDTGGHAPGDAVAPVREESGGIADRAP